MTPEYSTDRTDTHSIALAHLARAAAEVELLAAVAGSPRQSWPILATQGVSLDLFAEDDSRAIYVVLQLAARPDGPPTAHLTARRCRWLLERLNLWDNEDLRPFAGGSRWGPGPLAALLCRVPFDPDTIRRACARLRAARAAVEAVERKLCA